MLQWLSRRTFVWAALGVDPDSVEQPGGLPSDDYYNGRFLGREQMEAGWSRSAHWPGSDFARHGDDEIGQGDVVMRQNVKLNVRPPLSLLFFKGMPAGRKRLRFRDITRPQPSSP
jgi:hypothetical protein